MNLLKTINKSIEKSIIEFTKEIADKFELSQDELLEMWSVVSSMKVKTTTTKKLSPWLQFCKIERLRLKTEHPELTFGQISKKIGENWSAMSGSQRQEYLEKHNTSSTNNTLSTNNTSLTTDTNNTNTSLTTDTNNTLSTNNILSTNNTNTNTLSTNNILSTNNTNTNTLSTNNTNTSLTNKTNKNKTLSTKNMDEKEIEWTKEGLMKMKITELREICEGVKLSKTGTKMDLVERLLKAREYRVDEYDDESSEALSEHSYYQDDD